MDVQIEICIEWLRLQQTTKTINTRHASYGYKHIIEKWANMYISNDAFIEAVKRIGYLYKMTPSGYNMWVALSEKTVRLYTRRLRHQRGYLTEISPLKRKS